MPELWSLAGIAVSALLIGMAVGGTGIGGFLMIPAMMFFGGVPVRAAMGTALICGAVMGLWTGWLYLRKGHIDARLALPLAAGALVFSALAAQINDRLPVTWVVVALALIVILGSLSSLYRPAARSLVAVPARTLVQTLLLVLVGIAAGIASGLTGAGGPLVAVPLLALLGFPLLPVIGASQALQLAASLSGASTFIALGHWSLPALLSLLPGLLAGSTLGARWAHRVDPEKARRAVALIGLVAGIGLLLAALQPFSGHRP